MNTDTATSSPFSAEMSKTRKRKCYSVFNLHIDDFNIILLRLFRHIAEHMEVPMDTSKMTEQELQFHYFKMHDADNNNKLDGCELIKSLIHWHGKFIELSIVAVYIFFFCPFCFLFFLLLCTIHVSLFSVVRCLVSEYL